MAAEEAMVVVAMVVEVAMVVGSLVVAEEGEGAEVAGVQSGFPRGRSGTVRNVGRERYAGRRGCPCVAGRSRLEECFRRGRGAAGTLALAVQARRVRSVRTWMEQCSRRRACLG